MQRQHGDTTLHDVSRTRATTIYLLDVQAEDDLDAQEWMEDIQGVTACLLNGNVNVEALSRAQPKPTQPTHSRQGSRAGLFVRYYNTSTSRLTFTTQLLHVCSCWTVSMSC